MFVIYYVTEIKSKQYLYNIINIVLRDKKIKLKIFEVLINIFFFLGDGLISIKLRNEFPGCPDIDKNMTIKQLN